MNKMTLDLLNIFTRYDDGTYLGQPWNHKGKTYATDKAILIITPKHSEVDIKNKYATYICKAIAKYPRATEFGPLPSLPVPDYFCEECEEWHYSYRPVQIGKAHINAIYLFKLHLLPNCKISQPEEPEAPIHFIFDGGEGWLMPLLLDKEEVKPDAK